MRRLSTLWHDLSPTTRLVLTIPLLVGFYYVVPVDAVDAFAVPRIIGTVLVVVVLGRTILSELRNRDSDISSLVILFLAVVIVGSLLFFTLQTHRPQEFVGLETRTDALYFTLTAMTTVGFGDIHAQGQVARAVVSVLLVFDVVFIAALLSRMSDRLLRPLNDLATIDNDASAEPSTRAESVSREGEENT
ncbi:potassium channel family protein [Kineosphaera limosa]|uniref:potassium channel family protein n=1 Tax=Kineosphaera limosa TaxID=111564 RepID=UPI001C3F19B5|nr:potassium channel family protein [Kineosphaera limosa]